MIHLLGCWTYTLKALFESLRLSFKFKYVEGIVEAVQLPLGLDFLEITNYP